MKESLKVLQKIAEAKEIIRRTPIKKQGRNKFSNYDYYTPEQIVNIVQDACETAGIITMFRTQRTDLGIDAYMTIVDLTSGESVEYCQVTAIPDIKATNIAQQLGGMNTYSNRYLLMFIFDITDNNLDFDTTENTKKTAVESTKKSAPAEPKVEAKPELTNKHAKWADLVNYVHGGGTVDAIKNKYSVSGATETLLMKEVDAKK